MADPKYANLSGIAYDQPDLYETNDLPEADQAFEEPIEESESIESVRISAPDAFSKFKDKSLSSAGVDFSDRLTKHHRTGYDFRWGDGEKESPLERYQRLQCETRQLIQELSSENQLNDEDLKEVARETMLGELELMLGQLEGIRLNSDPATFTPDTTTLKKVLSELERMGGEKKEGGEAKSDGGKTGGGKAGQVRYEVCTRLQEAGLGQAARIAQLEARVNRINSLIAAPTPQAARRLGGGERSVVETARWLACKTSLLESGQAEAAEARLANLVSRLDQLQERTAHLNKDTQHDNKINELYEVAKTAEELFQVVPRALQRMSALESLHHQGAEFAKSLSELESGQRLVQGSCDTNRETLARLEESLTENMAKARANMASLQARLDALQAGRTPRKN